MNRFIGFPPVVTTNNYYTIADLQALRTNLLGLFPPVVTTLAVPITIIVLHSSLTAPSCTTLHWWHWLNSAWLVKWYSLRALWADSQKTLLATSIVASRITSSPCRQPIGLLATAQQWDINTCRRKRSPTVASEGVSRDRYPGSPQSAGRCPATRYKHSSHSRSVMRWSNPSQYFVHLLHFLFLHTYFLIFK
jgi:hypothetical protein